MDLCMLPCTSIEISFGKKWVRKIHNLVPGAFSSFGMVDRRNPWRRLPKWLAFHHVNFSISSRKLDEMSSFRLNNGFRLQKRNRATRRLKQPPKKPFHHVSCDKILHDSWSISAALAKGFSDPSFWTRRRPWGRGWEITENGCYIANNVHKGW